MRSCSCVVRQRKSVRLRHLSASTRRRLCAATRRCRTTDSIGSVADRENAGKTHGVPGRGLSPARCLLASTGSCFERTLRPDTGCGLPDRSIIFATRTAWIVPGVSDVSTRMQSGTPAEAAIKAEPAQAFGTDGIAPMERPGLMSRVFVAFVAWAERLNLDYSKVGNPPVYDNATFPWVREVEREWRAIRGELDQVLIRKSELPSFQDISTDVATI